MKKLIILTISLAFSFSTGLFAQNLDKQLLTIIEGSDDVERVKKLIGYDFRFGVGMERMEIMQGQYAEPDARDSQGKNPLHYAAWYNRPMIAKLLTESLSSVNAIDKERKTPLHYAALKGSTETAKVLIEKRANVDVKDWNEMTPLHYAAENNHIEIAKLLIIEGRADVDVKDFNNMTPLHFATVGNHVEFVKLLVIENKANVNVKDVTDTTPLHIASRNNYKEITKVLIEKGADVNVSTKKEEGLMTPLHYESMNKNTDIVASLIERGAKVDVKDIYGMSPLHHACLNGDFDTASVLIEKGHANVNVVEKKQRWTPLIMAVVSGNVDLVTLLLENRANSKYIDAKGQTPMDIALKTKAAKEIVELLKKPPRAKKPSPDFK